MSKPNQLVVRWQELPSERLIVSYRGEHHSMRCDGFVSGSRPNCMQFWINAALIGAGLWFPQINSDEDVDFVLRLTEQQARVIGRSPEYKAWDRTALDIAAPDYHEQAAARGRYRRGEAPVGPHLYGFRLEVAA